MIIPARSVICVRNTKRTHGRCSICESEESMTDYEYDDYQEVMKQALQTMNELLNDFDPQESEGKE